MYKKHVVSMLRVVFVVKFNAIWEKGTERVQSTSGPTLGAG